MACLDAVIHFHVYKNRHHVTPFRLLAPPQTSNGFTDRCPSATIHPQSSGLVYAATYGLWSPIPIFFEF